MEDSKKNYCNFHDSYLRQYIQQADIKASWLFAGTSAILIWCISQEKWINYVINNKFCILSLSITINITAFVIACIFSFNTIRPRLLNRKVKGIVYFGNVTQYRDDDEFFVAINNMSDEEIFKNRISSQYYMSKICYSKYNNLNIAVYFTATGFLLTVINHFIFTFN